MSRIGALFTRGIAAARGGLRSGFRLPPPSFAVRAIVAAALIGVLPAKAVPLQIGFSGDGWPRDALLPGTYAGRLWGKLLGEKTYAGELIEVKAEWKALGVFGGVAQTEMTIISNFLTDPPDDILYFPNVWYPTALAGHLARRDKSLAVPDMQITFNSDRAFYFGLDGKPPGLQYDFYTVMLHELAHGLGLSSLIDAEGSFEPPKSDPSAPQLPSVHDMFLVAPAQDEDRRPLAEMDPAERKAASRSGAVLWSGDIGWVLNGKKDLPIFSPKDFSLDSSLSHLDPAKNPRALMLPTYVGARRASDAVVELGMLYDIGWLYPADNLQDKLSRIPEPPAGALVVLGFLALLLRGRKTALFVPGRGQVVSAAKKESRE